MRRVSVQVMVLVGMSAVSAPVLATKPVVVTALGLPNICQVDLELCSRKGNFFAASEVGRNINCRTSGSCTGYGLAWLIEKKRWKPEILNTLKAPWTAKPFAFKFYQGKKLTDKLEYVVVYRDSPELRFMNDAFAFERVGNGTFSATYQVAPLRAGVGR